MKRRQLLKATSMAGLGLACSSVHGSSGQPHILLRSSWQTVNIGDIAHTPGVVALLQKHIPEAQVTLWPSNVDNGVGELLAKKFPKLKIARRGSDDLKRAFQQCDFLLHGSGPSVVAERDLKRWQEETGKPYGIYGITFPLKKSAATSASSQEAMAKSVEVLTRARFVFFRDSKSMALAKKLGAKSPTMQFGPDGAFACDLRDAARAEQFLQANGLVENRFLCCIPRLRYTPYWTVKKGVAFDAKKHARNEEMKESDHAPLRQAIVEVLEQTDLKILICPEDRTQMAVGKEMLYDKLPKNLLERVVWRPNYWLTGEAVSVYVRSAGLFGNEMHSPIMCIGHGVPAVVCRFAEQTSKGYMWEDIGLGDWLFDHDSAMDRSKIIPTILNIAKHPQVARAKAARAKALVEIRQRETMTILRGELGL